MTSLLYLGAPITISQLTEGAWDGGVRATLGFLSERDWQWIKTEMQSGTGVVRMVPVKTALVIIGLTCAVHLISLTMIRAADRAHERATKGILSGMGWTMAFGYPLLTLFTIARLEK